MKDNENIYFVKEIAETIGLEPAIILEYLQKNPDLLKNNTQDLIKILNQDLSFINNLTTLEDSLNKLIKLKLIQINDKTSNIHQLRVSSKNQRHLKAIDNKWKPDLEAYEVLAFGNIPAEFINNKLKEFKIFWIEKKQNKDNWNKIFIDFIRREWAKENTENKGLPYVINEDWVPAEDVFDVLHLSNITKDEAMLHLKEFIIYWRDSGIANNTWNSKFIEHVKRKSIINNIKNEKDKSIYKKREHSEINKEKKSESSWSDKLEF